MNFRIVRPNTAFAQQPTGKNSGRIEDKDYLEWIRSLPCAVSGRYPTEAAHLSMPRPELGKLGRGMSRKESDSWTVPLHPDEHRSQHQMNESKWWSDRGIDPCIVALALNAAYPDEEKARLILQHSFQTAQAKKFQS
jgi:hypothetical protein